MNTLISQLRNKQPVNLFKKVSGYDKKIFIKIQLNKKAKFICWERFYSLDRKNWVKQNDYLSLKDVVSICK